jgi:hypothetical protein
LRVGCALYYINRAESGGNVLWAAGVTKGLVDDDGNPVVSWTSYDNGITWTLPYQPDMSFNCTGIVVIPPIEETFPETETPYDDPIIVETETQTAVEWHETIPPEVEETLRDAAEDLDKEDELNAILEKYGCTAVVSMGSLTVLVTVAAAAFVTRKKK